MLNTHVDRPVPPLDVLSVDDDDEVLHIEPVPRTPELLQHTKAALARIRQITAEIGALDLPPVDVNTLMEHDRR